jgi:hypothetical protein
VIVADGDDDYDGKWNCRLMTVDLTSANGRKKYSAVSFFYPFTKLNFFTAITKLN